MSSLRANSGTWPPALWQLPQGGVPAAGVGEEMLTHRLVSKASTSALSGAGPVYVEACALELRLGFCVVVAPPPAQAPSSRVAATISSRWGAVKSVFTLVISLLAHAINS